MSDVCQGHAMHSGMPLVVFEKEIGAACRFLESMAPANEDVCIRPLSLLAPCSPC